MKLHNIWGYGQLFGLSALDGKNDYFNDFIGMSTAKEIEIRFEFKEWIKVDFSGDKKVNLIAFMSDIIQAETPDGEITVIFADGDTVVGCSPVLPSFTGEFGLEVTNDGNSIVYANRFDALALKYEKREGVYHFILRHAQKGEQALADIRDYPFADLENLKKQKYAYYETMPKCKNPKYERLYYKALSINKVNVRTAQGRIPCVWTTPNRVPHRHMWLWDSVFHALAMVNYNPEIAKSAIHAVITQIQPDGFMPHCANPGDISHVTQPQVLAWGTWEVYKKTGDKTFLREQVDVLERYLDWATVNRDINGNGLLEWLVDPTNPTNRCDESGWDNSPRFDFDEPMDAVDFSTFFAHDALYLSYIFKELGETEKAEKWNTLYEKTKKAVNDYLWDEEMGVYSDRLFSGQFSRVITPAAFLPLFASIPSKEQAEKMVKQLVREDLLWTKVPLSTVAKSHPTYSNDMWRGGVWLNLNYFIIKGLKNYGYDDLAQELIDKTLNTVHKWYKEKGTIFEFFDSADETAPYLCVRKNKVLNPPDWRKHLHAITDFNWSACFTLLFIQNDLY